MMRKQAEQQDNSAELREAFKIFDRDGNGFIDAAELKKVMQIDNIIFRHYCNLFAGSYSLWREAEP